MKKIIAAVMTLLFLGASGVTMADTPAAPGVSKAGKRTPGVKKRKHLQNKRIKQGVKSGELTKDEVKDLKEGRKELNQQIKDAKSDGVVTKDERKDLHQKMNEESKDIYEKKHNDEKQEGAK
jgi:hypothetical protein